MPENEDFMPPAWQELIRTREALARIETTLGLALGQLPLFDAKLGTFDARMYALEQAKLAASAANEANKAEINLLKQTLDAYELPPAFFKAWKGRVDKVVESFEKNLIGTTATEAERRKMYTLVGAIAGAVGFVAGLAPTLIDLARSL